MSKYVRFLGTDGRDATNAEKALADEHLLPNSVYRVVSEYNASEADTGDRKKTGFLLAEIPGGFRFNSELFENVEVSIRRWSA